jgi:hypothetical protein
VVDARVAVEAGTFRHLAPRAAGQEVTIPAAVGSNFGKRITLFVNGALGTCRVRPVSGTINGATSFTLAAGYVSMIDVVSNGKGGWATDRAAGYPTAGDGLSFSGDTLNVNVGNAITIVADAVSYTGSTSTVNLTPVAGDLNVVDISALQCGGVYTLQNVTDANIDGFTAKPDGFWFILHMRDATTSDVVTLIENNGNTTTSIRTPDIRDLRLFKNDAVMLIYNNSRWRCVAQMPKLWVPSQDQVTWAAQQDNFARSSRGVMGIRVTLTGNQTLTGVVPDGLTPNGEILLIENIDSVDTLTITHQTVSTAANQFLLPDSVNMKLGPRSGCWFRYDDTTSRWRPLSPSPHGRLLTRTVLTTGTAATFTHNPEARFFVLKGVGAGGGGGGTDAAAGAFGAGGGSGNYGERLIVVAAATSTYTVGVGGTGVSNAAGNNGTDTTWTHNAVTTTLPGGAGGQKVAGAATAVAQAGGASGAAATNADWESGGQIGGTGYRTAAATTPCFGGDGASTPMGFGGRGGIAPAAGSAVSGTAGKGPGAGGGGRANGTTATAAAGADGFRGEWIVEEYS